MIRDRLAVLSAEPRVSVTCTNAHTVSHRSTSNPACIPAARPPAATSKHAIVRALRSLDTLARHDGITRRAFITTGFDDVALDELQMLDECSIAEHHLRELLPTQNTPPTDVASSPESDADPNYNVPSPMRYPRLHTDLETTPVAKVPGTAEESRPAGEPSPPGRQRHHSPSGGLPIDDLADDAVHDTRSPVRIGQGTIAKGKTSGAGLGVGLNVGGDAGADESGVRPLDHGGAVDPMLSTIVREPDVRSDLGDEQDAAGDVAGDAACDVGFGYAEDAEAMVDFTADAESAGLLSLGHVRHCTPTEARSVCDCIAIIGSVQCPTSRAVVLALL